jgi:para-nitrobenzyl esterase
MRKAFCLFLVVCLIGLYGVLVSAEPVQDPIRISSGQVAGFSPPDDPGLKVYKGIPYVAPPVGDLRWKPPQPVKSWTGVRQATEPCAWCPQPGTLVFGGRTGPQSEDCLGLNVYTRAKDTGERLPVMVWLHGGGSTTGSGMALYYSGLNLTRKGVVLVAINYRLGPLGYMAHPDLSKESGRGLSGNYGFLDQIEALKWVKQNIAAFGGNPDNVTIFGESAGSTAVSRLLVSPLAQGLFHRAIAESGGPFGQNRPLKEARQGLPSAEGLGLTVAEKLGCAAEPGALACLRTKSPEEIIKEARPVGGLFGPGNKFGPIVDGWALPDDPGRLWLNKKIMPVPLLVGANADEGTIFMGEIKVDTVDAYRLTVESFGGDRAADLLKLFPVQSDADVRQALNKLIAVSAFIAPARIMAGLDSQVQPKVFLYHFTRVPPLPRLKPLGAFHAAEISYVFGILGPELGASEPDRVLSDRMSSYWTNFARTGDPNGPGLPAWPAYTPANDTHLELGAEVKTGQGLYRQACDLFEERARKQLSSAP